MTKEKLMQVYFIDKEIEAWKRELEYMRGEAYAIRYRYSGLPGAKGKISDAVAENAVRIADLERKISQRIIELEETKREVTEYILSIEDPQTRLIFVLRCLKLLSWNAVADKVGGMNTEYSVKKRFYRHLEKCG